MKANRLVLLAVAGVTMLSLTGCSAQSGNRAAEVGGEVVARSDVDLMVRVQCDSLDKAAESPGQAGQVQTTSLRQVRADMLNVLVQSEIDKQLAAEEKADYDKATFQQAMSQLETIVEQAAKKDRERFRELVGGFYKGQLQVLDLATKKLVGEGVAKPSQDEIQNAVAGIEADFRKSIEIEINPVYGANEDDVAGKVDPSLSRAVSQYAKQASSESPPASWVSGLPERQRCG